MRFDRYGLLGGILILIGGAVIFGVVGCSIPEDLGVPEWDVPFALPLSAQTYTLGDLESDEDAPADSGRIEVNEATGAMSFAFLREIDSTSIEEALEFEAEDLESYQVELGEILVDSIETVEGFMSIEEITGISEEGDFQVNAFEIPTSSQDVELSEQSGVEEVHVIRGNMYMELRNDTELTWDQVDVELALNETDYPEVGTFQFENISPNESQVDTIDLTGKTLKKYMIMFVQGGGPDQGVIEIVQTDGLIFNVWFDELYADQAISHVPDQAPRVEEFLHDLEQDDWVSSAVMSSGYLYYELENQIDAEANVSIEFVDLFDIQTNEHLRVDVHFNAPNTPNGVWTQVDSVDLSGMELRLDLPTNTNETQKLRAISRVDVLSSGYDNNNVPLTANLVSADRVIVNYTITQLAFSELYGVAKAYQVDIDEETQDIDVWENQSDAQSDLANNFQIENAIIRAELENEFEAPARVQIKILAVNNSHVPVIRDSLIYDRFISPGQDTLTFGRLEELINIMPDKITVSGQVLIGRDYMNGAPFDPFAPYRISNEDVLTGDIFIEAPLSFKIERTTNIRTEVTPFEEQLESEAVENDINVYVELRHGMPVGGKLFLLAGTFATEEEAREQLVVANRNLYSVLASPVVIQMPEVNPITGHVREPLVISDTLKMKAEKLSIFAEENVWTRQVLQLLPTEQNGEIVSYQAFATDSLRVSVIAEILYHVSDEED